MQTRRTSNREAFSAVLRGSYPIFLHKTFRTVSPGSDYLHNWHIDAISEHLHGCETGAIRRLIVNMPPRNLKSISITVAWSAWLLGHKPSRQIMAASYVDKLSIKHNVDTRLVCQSLWYREAFPSFRMAADQNEKTKFQTTQRGHRMAVSVGGAATGEGGDFLICDDPHNPKKALSEADRKTSLDWFDQTFLTRLNDKKTGVVVVVMQRLHENDLTGHLLEKGGWVHLKLQAEAERRQVITFGSFHKVREVDDILHPAREGPRELAQAKIDLGSYGYAGQYQQAPSPLAGGVIKLAWFQRYSAPPDPRGDAVRFVISIDCAQKKNETNDYTVAGVWAIAPSGWYLLDVWRERVDSVELHSGVASMVLKWKPVAVLIEDKSAGIGLIQQLQRGISIEYEGKETTVRVPVVAIEPDSDKVSRALNAAPMIEAGNVFLPELADWLNDFESELRNFPNAAHDDQVDMLTQFVSWIQNWQGSASSKAGGAKRLSHGSEAEPTNRGWGTRKSQQVYKRF